MTIVFLSIWLGLLSILAIGGAIHMMGQSNPRSDSERDSTNNPGCR